MKLFAPSMSITSVNTEVTRRRQEKAIIDAILDGNKEQYRVLVDRYHVGLIQHIFNIVHDGATAEDVAQEAFIQAYQKLARYNADFAFSTWLYKIGDSLAFRRLKQHKVQHDFSSLEETIADKGQTPEEAIDHSLQAHTIRQAVARLPRNYQRVVTLYYWDECSYEEIAAVTGRPIGTVRTWLYRAKEALRKELYGRV